MPAAMRLYFKLIGVAIRSQMQYRSSFLMLTGAYFLSTFIDIIGIWVLFDRFKMIQGWTLGELALIYGIMHMGFSLAEASAKGFDNFSLMVKTGDFDRVLLRPCSTLLQVAVSEFQLMRIGRFFQGLVILSWGCSQIGIGLGLQQAMLILLALLGTAALFYALFVMQATLSFWTIETLELMNIVTYGGLETGQYPMRIYPTGFRLFFTLIIPLACVAYYPMAVMLQHEALPLWMGAAFPVAGVIFLLVSFRLWKVGVSRYSSAGG